MLEPSNVSRLTRRRLTRRELNRPKTAARSRSEHGRPLMRSSSLDDAATVRPAALPDTPAAAPRRKAKARRSRFSLWDLFAPRSKSAIAPPNPQRRQARSARMLSAAQPVESVRPSRSAGNRGAANRGQRSRIEPLLPDPLPTARTDRSSGRGQSRVGGLRQSRRPKAELLSADPLVPTTPRKRRDQREMPLLMHLTRLVIVGVGVGSIVGTLLATLDPASRQMPASQATASQVSAEAPATANALAGSSIGAVMGPATMQLTTPMTPLADSIKSLAAEYEGLTPGIFVVDADTGAYVDLNGTAIFSTASTIKMPILVAFLQDVDAGKIQLDEMLTMRAEDVATGSGEMQYEPVGTRFTALATATEMITTSDNTATNMLIVRLGGAEVLNQRFREWGLTSTVIRTPLPDLQGTNTTTPKELVELTARVSQGDLLSLRSRDRLFDIMRRTVTNTLLPAGIEPEATIAHKTGDIGSLVGDVGMVDMPNGKRYLINVMVQRPHNDDRAQELIREISREVYQYLSQPPPAAAEAVAPAPSPN